MQIAKRLNEQNEKTPQGKLWTPGIIRAIIMSKAPLGILEYKIDGKPIGEIPLYPAVVDEKEYYAAHSEIHARTKTQGRIPHKAGNLFTGLLHYGDSKMEFVCKGKAGHPFIVNTAGRWGNATYKSFPYGVFEQGMLSELKELHFAHEQETPDAKLNQLEAKLRSIEDNRQKTLAYLTGEASGSFLELLAKYDAQKKEVSAEIEETKRTIHRSNLDDLKEAIKRPMEEYDRNKIKTILRQLVKKIEITIKEDYAPVDFTFEKIDGMYLVNGNSARTWCVRNHIAFSTLRYRHEQGLPMGKKIKELTAFVRFYNGSIREIRIYSNGKTMSSKWIPATALFKK